MTSAHNQGQGHGQQYDETAAKPSIGQKIGGGIEELVGKATNNPGKVAEGEAKKHGYAGPPGGAKGYNETLNKGENPGGLAGEHSINPSSHHGTTGNSHTGIGAGGAHTGNSHTGTSNSHTGAGVGGTHSGTGTGVGGTHNDRHEGLGHSSSHTGTGHGLGEHGNSRIGNTEPFPAGQGQPGFGGHPQQQSHHVGSTSGGGLGESRFEGQHSGLGGGSTSASRTHEGTGVGLGGGPAGHDSGLPLGSGAGGVGGAGHHGQHGGLTGNGQHGGLTGSGEHGGLTRTGQHGTGLGGNNVQPPFGGSERRY
ncbi:hypothetical protein I302_107042 [Kwoniella bestiolae CBS 10118]|uniref:Uncharacterized protein n=1 Tax=Kwoniella bestiolae CBS 10118 TaxID=1296100 RepID=A0A1B9FZN5_9TREE|nr:hypothetical protein I302_05693 [Kwoniella bestiolae CBS 10118]OCF24234.1 hypothetical protein I302_05693 [Kwoniella bestiolae CBS 10118]